MTAIDQVDLSATEQRSPSRAWRKLKANKGALVGLGIIAFFTLLAARWPIRWAPTTSAATSFRA